MAIAHRLRLATRLDLYRAAEALTGVGHCLTPFMFRMRHLKGADAPRLCRYAQSPRHPDAATSLGLLPRHGFSAEATPPIGPMSHDHDHDHHHDHAHDHHA